jgi:tetratricopeptide (TPR) repeat protein
MLEDGLDFAEALQMRGILHRSRGNYPQAIDDLEKARRIYESRKHLTGMAYVTGELGIVYYYLNRFADAIENYRRATESCEATKDFRGAMIGHLNIGDVLLQQRQYEEASRELTVALGLARKKKLIKNELTAGLYLIEAQIALARFEEAKDGLEALQPLLSNTSSTCAQGNALRLQANLYWQTGNYAESTETFQHALESLENPDCQYEMAHAQLDLAPILHDQGRLKDAQHALSRAEQIFAAIDNQLGQQALDNIRRQLALDQP